MAKLGHIMCSLYAKICQSLVFHSRLRSQIKARSVCQTQSRVFSTFHCVIEIACDQTMVCFGELRPDHAAPKLSLIRLSDGTQVHSNWFFIASFGSSRQCLVFLRAEYHCSVADGLIRCCFCVAPQAFSFKMNNHPG